MADDPFQLAVGSYLGMGWDRTNDFLATNVLAVTAIRLLPLNYLP